MACAGHLVVNNCLVVYAEILHGVLVCTEAWRRQEQSPSEPEEEQGPDSCDNNAGPSALPLLAPKPMARNRSFVLPKHKRQQDARSHSIVLSGHVVEVMDMERLDEAPPALPYSFIVKTKKMELQADGSFSSVDVDSVQLAAPDVHSKNEWMKRIEMWQRYGWRDTNQISATANDLEALESQVARWGEDGSEAFRSDVPPTPLRSTKRRFYRAMASTTTSSIDQDDGSNTGPWFQTRVVKTHI